MTEMGMYRVVGGREYRGVAPGEVFAANLERNAERRAVLRGDIEFLGLAVPALEPGSFALPEGWLDE